MTSQAINRSVHRELKDVHPGLGDANAAGDSIVKSQPERRTIRELTEARDAIERLITTTRAA